MGIAILPLPATVIGGVTGSSTAGGIAYAAELVAVCAVAVWALVSQWRRLRGTVASPTEPRYTSPSWLIGYAVAYLVVMAALWFGALPAYFGAVNGVTAHGDPIGSLWYTVMCFVIAILCIVAVRTVAPAKSDAPLAVTAAA